MLLQPLKIRGTVLRLFPKCFASQSFRKEIETLSNDIEERILQTLEPIDEDKAPKEVRPLINVINRLISYFEERSNHEQDFSANASHELRTPLAGIRLQTEIAMSTDDTEIQKQAHLKVLDAIDKNERLIEQLLILARLTADRVELDMTQIDIKKLLAQVVSDMQVHAKEKLINLKVEVNHNSTVIANQASISILLHNLIRNAINYSPEKDTVLINSISTDGYVSISVSDNGVGIKTEDRELALKRFQKLPNHNKKGSGLGLSIVKRICDLHQAKLTLSNTTKNGGLKVKVTFKR